MPHSTLGSPSLHPSPWGGVGVSCLQIPPIFSLEGHLLHSLNGTLLLAQASGLGPCIQWGLTYGKSFSAVRTCPCNPLCPGLALRCLSWYHLQKGLGNPVLA